MSILLLFYILYSKEVYNILRVFYAVLLFKKKKKPKVKLKLRKNVVTSRVTVEN